MNRYFCILGGGGIRGAAYPGVLKALEDLNIEITGFAGSSIGSVVAGLVTFGYSPLEIEEVFSNINFEFFKDINLNFGKDFALSKGMNFYEWIKNKIEIKHYASLKEGEKRPPVTFADIDKELVIFSVDLVTSKFHEFSKNKTPDVEIAHAIRVSVGMPGLYTPIFNEDECLVDGDLIKSMPLWRASSTIQEHQEKILEFRLEGNEIKKKISNTVDYLNAVYDSTSGFATDFLIETYKNHDKYDLIKLNLDGISVVDFMANKEKKKSMAKNGYETTLQYFKTIYPFKKEKLLSLYKDINSKYQKINFLLEENEIEQARFEATDAVALIFREKEILDKNIVSEIVSFKELFEDNALLKSGLFKKKLVLVNNKLVLTKAKEVEEKILNKITELENAAL